MRWQREPTEPGVYWVRNDWIVDRKGRQFVLRNKMPVLVTRESDGMHVYVPGADGSRKITDLPAMWLGPVEMPELPDEMEFRVILEGLAC